MRGVGEETWVPMEVGRIWVVCIKIKVLVSFYLLPYSTTKKRIVAYNQ